MKKQVIIISALLLSVSSLFAQGKYFTRDGEVHFFSETPMENIDAHNQKATCVLDTETGAVEFAVLIKSFEFEKALMEEHFNENYMESNEFPKATFKGQIQDYSKDLLASGNPVMVKGKMSIHGVVRDVEAKGKIEKEKEGMHLQSAFIVKPEDYDIEIPNTVRDNIAKEIEVKVDAKLKPLNK